MDFELHISIYSWSDLSHIPYYQKIDYVIDYFTVKMNAFKKKKYEAVN